MTKLSLRLAPAAFLTAFVAIGCFEGVGPEDVEPNRPPRLVNVTIEYRQPNACLNDPAACDDPVVFFASWMRPGTEFGLTRDPDTFVYRGIAIGVPVNYPPRDEPYRVSIFDPHIRQTESLGITALRLKVGGETLNSFDDVGTTAEHAILYVDADGFGHNPF